MLDFIAPFQSVVLGTLDEDGRPFSSYAPFVHHDGRFYVFISDLAKHARNLRRDKNASLFFIEDEEKSENVFARKRVSLQCDATLISREDDRFDPIITAFKSRFGDEMIGMLLQMADFNLFEFRTVTGEATFGFAQAYTIGGENMDELLPRRGSGGHQKVN